MRAYYLLHLVIVCKISVQEENVPGYIKQCKENDSQITKCIISSLEHLKPYLARGIPEIEVPSIEPFKIESLFLQLTEGVKGYKITFQNMDIYGLTNFKVLSLSMNKGGNLFTISTFIPKLHIKSKYSSSGVLLIIPASGGGDFGATLDGVNCNISGSISVYQKNNATYSHVDSLSALLSVEKPEMQITNAFQNNQILLKATNLFLRENGRLVLEAMQVQLQEKLSMEISTLANQVLKHVSKDKFYV